MSILGLALDHMDGQVKDIQVIRDHITVQLAGMQLLEEQLLTRIINVAYMQELTYLALTLRSCLVNGNSRSDHAQELKLEITYGWHATFCSNALSNLAKVSVLIQSCSLIGTVLAVIQITQRKP